MVILEPPLKPNLSEHKLSPNGKSQAAVGLELDHLAETWAHTLKKKETNHDDKLNCG